MPLPGPTSAVTQVPDASPSWRRFAACGGAIVSVLGLTVLVGWCLHSTTIERIVVSLPVMTAWTAIGLSLGGGAVVCLTLRGGQRPGRWLGGAMAMIGLLVLFEYLVAPIGMDQLLFRAGAATDPGRPSPQTALSLVLLGGALVTVDRAGASRWLHHGLLALSGMVVSFAAVGYLFGMVELRGVSSSNGVALHTLFGLVLLVLTTAALRPDRGLVGLLRSRGSAAIVARAAVVLGFAPVVVGAVVVALLHAGTLDYREALSLFTVTMIALVGIISLSLTVKVRRAEASTRELTGQLQALFDNAPVVLSLRDAAGRYLQLNRYGAAILGQAPEELIGQLPTAAEIAETLRLDDQTIARSHQSVIHEQRVEHADGTVRDYHLVRYPVVEDGQVRAFGTFGVDITEQKRTLTELQLAQAQFRSAFEEAPIGMMLQGLDGSVERVNPALCDLLGRSAESLLGQGAASFVAAEDRFLEASARAELRFAGAAPRTLELHYESAGDRRIPVEVHLTLVRGADQAPLHYLVQVQDTTERRRHQRELRFLADHDPLTGLLNRRAFLEALDRHRRHRDESGAVIVFDLDTLKRVNDTFGHHAGDALIMRTASISTTQLRATDVVARLGGDEFAVLLPGTSPEAAADVAHNLLVALNARSDAAGLPVRPIAASIGVVSFTGASSADEILQQADLAMYGAKREGGNRVGFASAPSVSEIETTHLELQI